MNNTTRLLALSVAATAAACVGSKDAPPASAPEGDAGESAAACIDQDKDGYGKNCRKGKDCDDNNPKITNECFRCARPETEGCACQPGAEMVPCVLESTKSDAGQVICHEGTRFCRDGRWTGCESVRSFAAPPSSASSAIVDPDAGVVRCNECYVNCYKVTDQLHPVDGGLGPENCDPNAITWLDGGGLTLLVPDAGVEDGGALPSVCTPGVGPDTDCDGIPNQYDPYPDQKPYQTFNQAIFLQLGPGQSGSGTVDVEFKLKTADVYFLLDQTGSMSEERIKLHDEMTSGTYVADEIQCADIDFDGSPNNELKSQGIAGAIRCLIPNSQLGAGFVREIPFSPHGDSDEILYRNSQDITADAEAVRDAIGAMTVDSNLDWPEGQGQALWNIATGDGMYMGYDRPGVPPRQDCPAGTWGYPCFREDTLPVVVLFTDAMIHNGPAPGYDYAASYSLLAGTTPSYVPVAATNEDFTTFFNAGDMTDALVTYTGNTSAMKADIPGSVVDCNALSAAHDAVFKFELTAPKTVTIDTAGSAYDTVLSLHSGVPTIALAPVAVSGNENHASAYVAGDLSGGWFIGTGNTAAMNPDYQGTVISCGAVTGGKDAVYEFHLSKSTNLSVDTEGSSFDTVLSLHQGALPIRPVPIAVGDTNDVEDTSYSAGEMNNGYKVFTGSTDAVGITANYPQSVVGCNADTNSPDAVYSFRLSQPTRVRIDTEDSSFDTVISLHKGSITVPVVAVSDNTNEDMGSALDLGDATNSSLKASGNTSTMLADFTSTYVGCGAATQSPDAVAKFTVGQEAPIQINTIGSCFDTVISLYNGISYSTVLRTTVPTQEVGENQASAYNLGDLYRGYFDFQGGSIASNDADYLGSTIGCGAGDDSPDIVFKFTMSQGSHVRIDGSRTPFDNVISVHDGPIPLNTITPVVNTNEDEASAYNVGVLDQNQAKLSGNTTSMIANYPEEKVGCGADANSPDAVYKFTLNNATEVRIDTEGSAYNTVIGLYRNSVGAIPPRPAPLDIGTSGEIKAAAYDAGTLDNQWLVYKGKTTNMNHNWGGFGCSAVEMAKDVFVKFTLNSQRAVTIDTINSSFDTVIGLFRYSNDSLIACDNDSGGGVTSKLTATLGAGVYFVIVKATSSEQKGDYELSIRDNAVIAGGSFLTCDNDSGPNLTSVIQQILQPATYYVVVKGDLATDKGAYRLNLKDVTHPPSNHQVECANGPGNSSVIERWLDGGKTYYLVLKGAQGEHGSNYKIVMQDLDAGNGQRVACDNDSGPDNSSLIQQTLAPGTYYVVVKGATAEAKGCYNLNVFNYVTATANLLACDDDSGPNNTSVIERDLAAGTYYVVVKGYAAAEKGPYALSLRDVTVHPDNRLSCNDDYGGNPTSRIDANLGIGTYYAVVKSKDPAAGGDYRISIRDTGNQGDLRIACNDDDGTAVTSKITQSLEAGSYYVVLKGKAADAGGSYQLTFGAGTPATGAFVPRTWAETTAALQDRGIKVMSVLSCQDDPAHGDASGDCVSTRDQTRAAATATGALGLNNLPLVYDINVDGSGVAEAVVQGVQDMTEYMRMDVSARVLFSPDDNPGFYVSVEAVDDGSGDGCEAPIGIEHQNCLPGATPKFRVTFTNPYSPAVPINPDDPKGGYSFKVELVGDSRYVLDTVPVYIIPAAAADSYPASGSYWQDIQGKACSGNDRPSWTDLSWTAELPDGTSVAFEACAADSPEGLQGCTYEPVATASGSGSCLSDSDCSAGFCAFNKVCQYLTAGSCEDDGDCLSSSTCLNNVCIYAGQPVDIGAALGPNTTNPYLRVRVTLHANGDLSRAPILYDWTVNYICSSQM